jgi:hypothetical protein
VEQSAQVVPTSYEIRIKGRLGKPMVASFGDFTASVKSPETILSGAIPDQRALHVLLERIGSLGLELLEVRQLQEAGDGREQESGDGPRGKSNALVEKLG